MGEASNDALLLALILGLPVHGRRWLVRSGSNTNVGSDALCAETVDSLVAELDCLAHRPKGSFEVGAVAAARRVDRDCCKLLSFSFGCISDGYSYLLNFVTNTLIQHPFKHSLTFCDVFPYRCCWRAHGDHFEESNATDNNDQN